MAFYSEMRSATCWEIRSVTGSELVALEAAMGAAAMEGGATGGVATVAVATAVTTAVKVTRAVTAEA